jgi:hypothetical protein
LGHNYNIIGLKINYIAHMMMRELNKLKHVSYNNDNKVWELINNSELQCANKWNSYIENNHQQQWGKS